MLRKLLKTKRILWVAVALVMMGLVYCALPSSAEASVYYQFQNAAGTQFTDTTPLIVTQGDTFLVVVHLNTGGTTVDVVRASLGYQSLGTVGSRVTYDTVYPNNLTAVTGFSATGRPVDLKTGSGTVAASVRLEPDGDNNPNVFNETGAVISGFMPAADAAYDTVVAVFAFTANQAGTASVYLLSPVYSPNDSTGILISTVIKDGTSVLDNVSDSLARAISGLVVVNFPGAPLLTAPPNGIQTTNNAISCSWTYAGSTDTQGYEISVYQNASGIPTDYTAPDTVFLSSQSSFNTTLNDTGFYAWRVRAYGESTALYQIYSAYSETRVIHMSQQIVAGFRIEIDSNASITNNAERHVVIWALNQYGETAVGYNGVNDTARLYVSPDTVTLALKMADGSWGAASFDSVYFVNGRAETDIRFTFATPPNYPSMTLSAANPMLPDSFVGSINLNAYTIQFPRDDASGSAPPVGSQFSSVGFAAGSDSLVRQLLAGIIVEFWDYETTDTSVFMGGKWHWTSTSDSVEAMTDDSGRIEVSLTPGIYYVRYRADSDACFLNTIPDNPIFHVPDDLNLPHANLLVGDIDGNGVVDVFDFSEWLAIYAAGGSVRNTDVDGNGVVDVFDFSAWLGTYVNGITTGDF